MTKVAQSGCDLAHFDVAVNFGSLKEVWEGGGGFVAPFYPLAHPLYETDAMLSATTKSAGSHSRFAPLLSYNMSFTFHCTIVIHQRR